MQGRMTPRLIGFLSEVEREFFELFCSVDGVGVKKALRAMVRPVKEVATAIEEQDAKLLSSLPGIGPAMSERIIAKLRRKVPKFALMVAQQRGRARRKSRPTWFPRPTRSCGKLGHSESDARRLLDTALAAKKKYADVQSLLAGDLPAEPEVRPLPGRAITESGTSVNPGVMTVTGKLSCYLMRE